MVSTEKRLKQYLERIKKQDTLNGTGKKINSFLQLNPDAIKQAKAIDAKKKKGKLAGKIIAVKANINVKGMNISCASKVLENYNAPYDATVIKKIKEEDGLIIGITNQDEFACGSSGETSAFGPTQNPAALGKIPGGSSSGSAAAVAAEFCDMSLGSDTGCSIRVPGSFCGIIGVKPTYSSVSRYGLCDLSMSLDQIGPLARTVEEAALLLSVINGYDKRDAISQESKINLQKINQKPKQLTIGILDFPIKDKRIQDLIENKVNTIAKENNFKVKKIKIENIDLAVSIYYPLVYVEFFSATRKLDGRRYGKKIEDAAGPEVLRRILGGAEITKAEHKGRYYHQALKAKKLIEQELANAFKKVDCIISPVTPKLPHNIGDKISVQEMYEYDALTIPHNLYGNCALSIPIGKIDNIPVGMQIACDRFQDEKMLQIARLFE